MSQSLVAEDEDVRQSCFTKSAEEPACLDVVCTPVQCPGLSRDARP